MKTATKATNPDAAQVWSLVDPLKQIMPHEEVEKALIENEKNVYFGSEIDTLTKFDSIPCLVSTNSDSYFGHPVAFALQKNSPYKYLINSQLTRMKESGQIKRIMQTHIGGFRLVALIITELKNHMTS